jgi:8-oxo-dGTP diphosphatase
LRLRHLRQPERGQQWLTRFAIDCAVPFGVAGQAGVQLDASGLEPGGTMFRRSLEPRVDIFFVARSWTGTPEIREPHKCTELVWAGPDDLPADALDFVGQAITNARTGRHFYEYGWETAAVQTTG